MKQLSAVKNVKTTINLLETIRSTNIERYTIYTLLKIYFQQLIQYSVQECLEEEGGPFKQIMLVIDVNNLKNGRKPVKLQKESPAGCDGEGKQSKGN